MCKLCLETGWRVLARAGACWRVLARTGAGWCRLVQAGAGWRRLTHAGEHAGDGLRGQVLVDAWACARTWVVGAQKGVKTAHMLLVC